MKDLLNIQPIKEWQKFKQKEIYFTIGVDKSLGKICSYAIVKTTVEKDGTEHSEIVNTKCFAYDCIEDTKAFDKEVKNLSRYFDAVIIE